MTGFGSDGASTMVGVHDGVAAKVKRENDAVIAIHCLNHRLALATKDNFESQKALVKLDSTVTSLYKYYKNSSVRASSLVEVQKILNKAKGTTIKRSGFTRWLSPENAMNSIRKNFHAIIVDLENAAVNGSSSSGSGPTAADLLKHVKTFNFYRLIHFMCDVLAIISKLTLTFEKRDLDISRVEDKVIATLDALKKLKRKPGGLHCRNLEENARKIGITAPICNKDSIFASTASDFIDTLIKNISHRLENVSMIMFLSILNLKQMSDNDSLFYGMAEMTEMANFYKIDEDSLLGEWDDFKNSFYQGGATDEFLSLPNLCETVHKLNNEVGDQFPLLKRLLCIANTLPLSTSEVEKVFSQVQLIITDHQSRLKVDNVENLLMVKLNGEIDFESSVQHWLKQKNRRIFKYVVL